MLSWSVTHELWAVLKDTLTPAVVPPEFVATSSKR